MVHLLAGLVSFAAVLVALALAVHVVFVVSSANQANVIVRLFARLANDLAPAFKDLFNRGSAKRQAALNYGLPALLYLVVGQILARVIRRAD